MLGAAFGGSRASESEVGLFPVGLLRARGICLRLLLHLLLTRKQRSPGSHDSHPPKIEYACPGGARLSWIIAPPTDHRKSFDPASKG